MDDDIDTVVGLTSLASFGIKTNPSRKGKPRAPRKTATMPKKKKEVTPGERARESAKRKGRRHAADARDEAAATAAIAVVAQWEDTVARIATAMREALLYLGLNPGHHGLVNAAMATTSTGPSEFPQMVLPGWPRASVTRPIPGFHVYPQAFRLVGEYSPEVSVVAPSTLAPRTHRPQRHTYSRWLIIKWAEETRAGDAVYLQARSGRLDLDGFLLDHVFADDYGLEEEDGVDIDGEPLFADELANQAVGMQPKRKSRWTKA
ncbi:putative serine/threonine-protein kinase [Hordeum vulgare]|nr:putative serine/threonine-protein kinase [Hordeum vulgare]